MRKSTYWRHELWERWVFGRTFIVSTRKYEIKCQWQSWTCSLLRKSVLICSARPLCLSHCHCQLFHCGWSVWPFVLYRHDCLLPMLHYHSISCFFLLGPAVVLSELTRHLPDHLRPCSSTLSLCLILLMTFWTSCFPLVANPCSSVGPFASQLNFATEFTVLGAAAPPKAAL